MHTPIDASAQKGATHAPASSANHAVLCRTVRHGSSKQDVRWRSSSSSGRQSDHWKRFFVRIFFFFFHHPLVMFEASSSVPREYKQGMRDAPCVEEKSRRKSLQMHSSHHRLPENPFFLLFILLIDEREIRGRGRMHRSKRRAIPLTASLDCVSGFRCRDCLPPDRVTVRATGRLMTTASPLIFGTQTLLAQVVADVKVMKSS